MLTQPHCFETRDAFIYAQLMKSFSRSRKDSSIALQLFQDMEARGLQPDLVAYNTAITAAGEVFWEGGCAWQFVAVGHVWCLRCSAVAAKPVKQQPCGSAHWLGRQRSTMAPDGLPERALQRRCLLQAAPPVGTWSKICLMDSKKLGCALTSGPLRL